MRADSEGADAVTDDVVPNEAWRPDVLGDDWECRDLALPGGAVATLVRHRQPATRHQQRPGTNLPTVLYLHGFVDFFFHPHVARAFEEQGYRFYALDLRGYGRSIGRGSGAPVRPNDTPNFVTDLSVYAQDLDAAVRAIRADRPPGSSGRPAADRAAANAASGPFPGGLIVLAHSMGGLVASMWANTRPGLLDALVLNSPWFDVAGSWFLRGPVTWGIDLLGRIAPRLEVAGLGSHYGPALHVDTGGEWSYNLAWKPHQGFPVRAGWLRTIRRTQHRLARGLSIDCPILVLTSDRSGPPLVWHAELVSTDSVLDVDQIRRRAVKLGPDVTRVVIEKGAHDLALSPEPARSHYLTTILEWLARRARR